jgi:tripartite motif-containing protein 71
MTSAKHPDPSRAHPPVHANRGELRVRTRLPLLVALVVCTCALGGCGGSGRQGVALEIHAGAHCPGGAVTGAYERTSIALRSTPGAGRTQAAGCPYETAATIGRPGEGVFREPEALAIAPSGRVYVADQFSHQVQMFSPAGAFEGQWGSAGAAPGDFGAVGGLAIDSRGDVYLVDSTHNRVEKHDSAGRFIASFGSPGKGVGQFSFGAGSGPDMPPGGGIAVGSSYVYVSDTRNNRIERFALNGTGATVVAGAGSGSGEVLSPEGLALAQSAETLPGAHGRSGAGGASDAAGALYVADNGNDRVEELAGNGRFIARASVFDARPDMFQNPWDVAVHGGSVYVVDNNHGRIVRFSRTLRFTGTFSGSGPYRLSDFVRAVATERGGDVYVADSNADRVDVFTPAGALLRGWGSSVRVAGCCASRAGEIASGQFVAPVDVVAGPGSRLLVAEAFREIVPLYPTGAPQSFRAEIAYDSRWSTGGGVTLGSRFFAPAGLALAPDGTVWVTDRNNDVLRHLSASGQFLGAVGSVGTARGAHESLRLTEPHGVAVDRAGAVVVANTGADRIDRLSPEGRLLAAWSSPTAGLSDESGSETRAGSFQRPLAVAVGAGGNIYVANTGRDRIEELNSAGRLVASWGGPGSAPGLFESPDGIAVDGAGDVFVADGVLDRVQEFGARGKLLAVWGRSGTGLGELGEPTGMTVDCRGDLLVADTGNNRVAIFTGVAPAAPCLP